jgi:hypothetical protein
MDRDLLRCVLPPLLALGIVLAISHPLDSPGDEDARTVPDVALTHSTGAPPTEAHP